ncbi:MAG: elongation factor 1-beta [Candidatus Aenigmarchaeota archaeon]|nr:elongation factor 1-beta [Candidatus Aenigmarchaeota archaeon]
MSRGVLATFKIMPESLEVDLEALKEKIKILETIGNIKDFKEEPIAFGLKSLSVLTLIADEGGLTEKIENKLSELEGVQSVENVGVTLI